MAFFGIGYFDQTEVALYAIIVMIAVVATGVRQKPMLATNENTSQDLPSISDGTLAPIESTAPTSVKLWCPIGAV